MMKCVLNFEMIGVNVKGGSSCFFSLNNKVN